MNHLGSTSKLVEDLAVEGLPWGKLASRIQEERVDAIVEFLKAFEDMETQARQTLCARICREFSDNLGMALYRLAGRL
jgi:hypothetical protein